MCHRWSRKWKPKHQAFTLWELLCILLVLFFLVGLLVPSLNRSRSMSTKVVCLSYLRQYSLAGNLYLDDFKGLFPFDPKQWLFSEASIIPGHPFACRWHDRDMSFRGPTMQTNSAYQGVMWPYMKDMNFGPCPTFRRYAPTRGCMSPGHTPDMDIIPQLSYSINGYLGNDQPGGVRDVTQLRDPAKVFFFAEENTWTVSVGPSKYTSKRGGPPLSTKPWDDTVLMIRPGPEVENCFATYHGVSRSRLDRGSGNVAFIDGHVESVRYEDQLIARYRSDSKSRFEPMGNLAWAWADKSPMPDSQKANTRPTQ